MSRETVPESRKTQIHGRQEHQRVTIDVWHLQAAQGNILTHFEVCGLQGGTGEEPGEHHVDGDGQSMADVALRNLDVLDLCGISCVPFSAAWEHIGERRPKTVTHASAHTLNEVLDLKHQEGGRGGAVDGTRWCAAVERRAHRRSPLGPAAARCS